MQGKDFVDISHTNITDSLIMHGRQFQISVKYWNLLSLKPLTNMLLASVINMSNGDGSFSGIPNL